MNAILANPVSIDYILDRSVLNYLVEMVQAGEKRPVGRPREFDEETALEAAMDAFWRKGYEATSLTDLCCCTGLHKGSLYQAFGDKHCLFMRALRHYSDREFEETTAALSPSRTPLENIRALANKIIDDGIAGLGCMMVNSMVELAPHDPAVKAELQRAVDIRIEALAGLIQQGLDIGEIRAGLEPPRLARQFMVTLAGVSATIKGYLGAEDARDVIGDLIESWK